MRRFGFACLAVSSVLFATTLRAGYDARLAAAVGKCEAIPAKKSHTALWFNPEGFRSYFERSRCFQGLALDFRQPGLCRKVRQHRSFFGSSWGYSERNCRKLVRRAVKQDEALVRQWRQGYQKDPVRLLRVSVQRDGNGRDFDVVPAFSAGFAHAYRLRVFVLDGQGRRQRLLDRRLSLGTSNPAISLFVEREAITRAIPGFSPAAPRSWVFELEPSLPAGRGNALWPPAWVERQWPRALRLQVLETCLAVVPRQPGGVSK